MRKRIKQILTAQYNEVTKDALKLGIGAVIAQAISFGLSPIIARIYPPEEFGLFSTFSSFTSILITLGVLKYEMAIVLPKKDEDAKDLMRSSFLILCLITFIIFLILLPTKGYLSVLLGNEGLNVYLLFSPILIFLVGTHNIIDNWNNRNKEYKLISSSRVVLSSSNSVTSIAFGTLKSGFIGLVYGNILSELITIAFLLKKHLKRLTNFKELFGIRISKKLLKEYKNFPLYILPSSFIDIASKQVPVLFIASIFNPYYVGIYALAYKIVYLPMSIIGMSFSQPFYKEFTDNINENKNPIKLLYKTWVNLLIIGIIPATLLFFGGETMITLLFGEKWAEAGSICSIMSFMMIAILVSYPTSNAFLVLGLQKQFLAISILGLILRPLSIYLGSAISFKYSVLFLMITEIIIISIYNLLLIKEIKSRSYVNS